MKLGTLMFSLSKEEIQKRRAKIFARQLAADSIAIKKRKDLIKMSKEEFDITEALATIKLFTDQGMHKQAKMLRDKYDAYLAKNCPTVSQHAERVLATYLTKDDYTLQMLNDVRRLACEEDTVLIIGESGTGKEIIAKSLLGNRQGNFISLNCAGMPKELIESELFGHKAGAFSGASTEHIGLFRAAQDGCLFLDEVGDLDPTLQAKLLRAIQERKVRPVGATLEYSINCRIIAATHHDLTKMVEEKQFRLDLYARLSTIELITKPLRDRVCDIELLVNSMDESGRCYKEMEAIGFWNGREFPLNVRDIQRIVRRWELFGIERFK